MTNIPSLLEEQISISTIESHTAGEPLRVIIEGYPVIEGDTILEKREFVKENFDHLRKGLMLEPRGHSDMYGAIITESTTPDGDLGVIFTHNDGYSSMCGHGVIALTKVVLETGMLEEKDKIKIDTPAGRVESIPKLKDGKVEEITFVNVPSFVYKTNLNIETHRYGKITFDIAFGGAFYAYLSAKEIGLEIDRKNHDEFVKAGRKIKQKIKKKFEIEHPYEDDLGFLYGVIFVGPPTNSENHSSNVCVFADGEVDRSPTGTGVSGRAALHHSKGDISENEEIVIESILGTIFKVEIVETTKYGDFDAVIPKVTGSAHITGKSEFYFDPNDPLRYGFKLR